MADLKTKKNDASVAAFLDAIEDDRKRDDAKEIARIMAEITGEPAKMYGSSIVGFGNYRYQYASGKAGEWFVTGFSPRKQNLTLYIMPGFSKYQDLLAKLGKHKTGKSCLYIKKLADVDSGILKTMIQHSVDYMAEKYPKH